VGPDRGDELPVVELDSDVRPAARPAAVVTRGGSRRRRGVVVVGLVVAVAVVLLVAVLGGSSDRDGDDEAAPASTTSAPRAPTTTAGRGAATTLAPGTALTVPPAPGPLLGQPTGLELVGVTAEGVVVVVDLDTGATTVAGALDQDLRNGPHGVLATPAGVLAVTSGGQVLLVRPDGSVEPLGEGSDALVTPERTHVWTTTYRLSGAAGATRIGLLDDGRERVAVPEGASAFPVGARRDALLIQSQAGGVYALPLHGGAHRLAPGAYVTSDEHHLVTSACDEALSCELVITRDGEELHRVPVRQAISPRGRFSPDGRWVALAGFTDGAARAPQVVLVDLAAGTTVPVELQVEPWAPLGPWLAWSPDGRWLVGHQSSGGLAVHDTATGATTPLDVPGVRLLGGVDLRAKVPGA